MTTRAGKKKKYPAPTNPRREQAKPSLPKNRGPMRLATYEVLTALSLLLLLVVYYVFAAWRPLADLLIPLSAVVLVWSGRLVFPENPKRALELGIANGLMAFLFVRPLIDAVTFPNYDIHFLWWTVALLVLWAGHDIFSGPDLRFWAPTILLTLFLAVALLGCLWTIRLDATYRGLLNWTTNLLLFVIAASVIRSRLALSIVLGGFICITLVEASYAIIHLMVMLPKTRALIAEHPELLKHYTGSSNMSGDLAHRLTINRAFGTLLFANALAAFLLPGVLFSSAATWAQVLRFRETRREARSGHRTGAPLRIVRLILLFVTACTASAALVLTFSRGGMAGLVGGAIVSLTLVLWRKGPRKAAKTSAPSMALVLALMICLAAATLGAQGGQSDDPAPGEGVAAAKPEAPPAIRESGYFFKLKDLLTFDTLQKRFGYWGVGIRMLKDYALGGVGLGNFGAAYPIYQYIGAEDVRQAHNDYLQTFCETGIAGFSFFCAFWLYFLIWGARRILRQPYGSRRWLLGGLYGGILAFLLHSGLDFNFVNQSLTSPVMILTGAFYALALLDAEPRAPKAISGAPQKRLRLAAAAGLLALALGATIDSVPPWRIQNESTDEIEVRARIEAADFLLGTCAPTVPRPPEPPQIDCRTLRCLIPARADMETFGKIFVPRTEDPRLLRPLAPNEPLVEGAIFAVADRNAAYALARKAIHFWIDRAETTDARYPHTVELAVQLYRWHDLLLAYEQDLQRAGAPHRRMPSLGGSHREAQPPAGHFPRALRPGALDASLRRRKRRILRKSPGTIPPEHGALSNIAGYVAHLRGEAQGLGRRSSRDRLHGAGKHPHKTERRGPGPRGRPAPETFRNLGGTHHMPNRIDRLRALLEQAKCNAYFSVDPACNQYLAAFRGSTSTVVITLDQARFFCDFRYEEQAGQQVVDLDIEVVSGDLTSRAGAWLNEQGASSVAVEPDCLSVAVLRRLEEAFTGGVHPTAGLVSALRQVKSDYEIAQIKTALQLSEGVLSDTLSLLGDGLPEQELAAQMEYEFKKRGASGPSFDTIALFGPRSSLPHGQPTGNALCHGDVVLLDFGCRLDGYCSDLTRTFAFGSIPGPWFEEVYDLVLTAQQMAIEAARPGMACRDLDGVARKFISEAGHGEHFGHGLGHGVGLEVHEGPRLNPRSDVLLEPGMVVTIEPGVYVPGEGGIRIEDVIAITEEGCTLLSSAPKKLKVFTE